MEKQSKEDLLISKLMRDAGLEKPSSAFSANVMNAIAARKVVKEYKPLLSKQVWAGVFLFFVLSVIGLFFTTSTQPLLPVFNWNVNFINYLSFPKIEFSRTMIYAIGCLSLFLLEIPFLKNLMEKPPSPRRGS